jgi:hypothetical protein
MRCFEIIADGGLLLTDKLSPYSGFFEVFQPGVNCLVYSSPEELLEMVQAHSVLRQVAPGIIAAGHQLYEQHFNPRLARTRLIEALQAGIFPAPSTWDDRAASSIARAPLLPARIAIYEEVQEIHRLCERVFVDLSALAVQILGADLDDLPRLRPLATRDQERPGDATLFIGTQEEQPDFPYTHFMRLEVSG